MEFGFCRRGRVVRVGEEVGFAAVAADAPPYKTNGVRSPALRSQAGVSESWALIYKAFFAQSSEHQFSTLFFNHGALGPGFLGGLGHRVYPHLPFTCLSSIKAS